MCEDCGCGDTDLVSVEVHEGLLAGNDEQAAHNRAHFEEAGVLAINLMGSPGSGKTALLEATAETTGGRGIAALSGDLATDRDGERLRAAGIPARTITTGSACHLDARQVHRALHEMAWEGRDLLFIENVGNLVCPSIYDLGQAACVVVLSVTEGDDKPEKYPVMFRKADLVLLSKTDLLPHLPGFSRERFERSLARVMPEPRWFPVSALTGEGMAHWIGWLEAHREVTSRPASPPPPHHHHPEPAA